MSQETITVTVELPPVSFQDADVAYAGMSGMFEEKGFSEDERNTFWIAAQMYISYLLQRDGRLP